VKKSLFLSLCVALFLLSTVAATCASEVVHKVKQGENLWTIAKKYQVSVSALQGLNGLSSSSKLKVGQSVIVKRDSDRDPPPAGRKEKAQQKKPPVVEETVASGDEFLEYKVKKGDTLEQLARQFDVETQDIVDANDLKGNRLKPGRTILIPKSGPEEGSEEFVTLSPGPLKPWKNRDEQYMLVKVAKSFMGAPYKLGGESVKGLDCSAFVKKIYDIFDVQLPRCAREQYRVGNKINRDGLVVGDLVFFKTRRYAKYPTHVGIYIGDGNFIHSSSGYGKIGVKIDSLASDYYTRTYVGATRVKQSVEDAAKSVPEADDARRGKS
jgi:peptidoglycan DL-endopeptidase LytE